MVDEHRPILAECKVFFDQIRSANNEMKALLTQINSRLFMGNGTPPFATRLDRLEQAAVESEKRAGRNRYLLMGLIVPVVARLLYDGVSLITMAVQTAHESGVHNGQ